MITYLESISEIAPEMLTDFWQKWDEKKRVVGFITALTDNVFSAYIQFVEVLPDYQGQGDWARIIETNVRQI